MTSWYATTMAAGFSTPVGVAVDPATGDAYVSEGNKITKVAATGTVSVLAGNGTAGFADGKMYAAMFNGPRGMIFDGAGNLLVADFSNNRIRRVARDGTVTTIAGTGTAGGVDGPALSATFYNPAGLAVDGAGNLYIAEMNGNRVRKLDTGGQVTTVVGSGAAGFTNGVGTAATFSAPVDCAVTADGATLYVSDWGNNAVRAVDLATRTVSTYLTGLAGPWGLKVHPVTGWLYVVAENNHRVVEVAPQVTPAYNGSAQVATPIVGSGGAGNAKNAYGTAVTMYLPTGLAFNPRGELLVAEYNNGQLTRATPQGVILRDRVITEADSNTITVTIPASTQAGDQIVVRLSHATADNVNAPQDTTCSDPDMVLIDQSSYAAKWILTETWTKIAQGGDGGAQVTFTVPAAATVRTGIYLGVYYNGSIFKPATAGPALSGAGTSPPFSFNTGNLALNRPATASSTYDATAAYAPSNAFDGSTTTRWSSAAGVDPSWIYVDLGAVRPFSQVVFTWEGSYAKQYQLQVSDDATTWTTVYTQTASSGGTETVNVPAGTRGRYVRMYGTQRATALGYSMWEFQVIGGIQPAIDGNGLALLLGTVQGSGAQWTASAVPAGFAYRGQVNIPSNTHALGVADGMPGTAAKTFTWTSTNSDYLTHVAVVPPKQGSAGLDATVTLSAAGYSSMTPVTAVSDTDTATGADNAPARPQQTRWWVSTVATGLSGPQDVVVDEQTGDLYVTEASANRITKITAAGVKTVVAGAGAAGSAGSVALSSPRGIARDAAGAVYWAEYGGNRVRKLDPAGNVTTVAGTGTAGFAEGAAASAQLNAPAGVAVDSAGNVYIVEVTGAKVRKVDPTGNVSLVAGSPTASTPGNVDAVGAVARFNQPWGCRLSLDEKTLYVTDYANNAVRKVDLATGAVGTVAVSVSGPWGIGFNPATGMIYIGSDSTGRVSEVTLTGTVTSIAGTGAHGLADNIWGSTAQLNRPAGSDNTADGTLIVADFANGRLRQLTQPTSISGYETATVTDAHVDPVVTWTDKATFTESAVVTFVAVSSADTGKGTETQKLSFQTLTAADTGAVSEMAWFGDPDSGPATPRWTGRADQGTFVAANTSNVTIGPITVNPGEVVLVAFAAYHNSVSYYAPRIVSGLGLTWTGIGDFGLQYLTGMAYWAVNRGDAPVTGDVTLSYLYSGFQYTWIASYYINVNPAQPVRNNAQTTTPPLTLGAPLSPATSRSVAVFSNTGTTVPTPRTGWQQIAAQTASSSYVTVHWQPVQYDTTATATPTPARAIGFELTAPPYPVSDTDSGSFTDDQADPAVWWGDTGAFTDDAAVGQGGADTGKVTEASIVAVPKTSFDSGVVDEAAILQKLTLEDDDQVAATQDATVTAQLGDGDTATGDDTVELWAVTVDGDSGLITDEVIYVGTAADEFTDTDSATFDDQAVVGTLVGVVGDADSGTFTEYASIGGDENLAVADTDSATLDDTIITFGDVTNLQLSNPDTGLLTDTHRIDAQSATADSFTATDAGAVTPIGGLLADLDTAAIIDEAVAVAVAGGDTGNVTDTVDDLWEPWRAHRDSDRGGIRDRLLMLVMTVEGDLTGSGLLSDDTAGADDTAQPVFAAGTGDDTATATDTEDLLGVVDDTDTATAVDTQELFASPVDDDPIRLIIEDAAVAELASPTVSQVGFDTAAFTDTPGPLIDQTTGDTATGVDNTGIVGPLDSDTATGVDASVVVALSGDDAGTLTEADPLLEQTTGDTAALTEPDPQVALAATDTGAATDAEELFAALTGDDPATGDDQTGGHTATVPADDIATGVDTEELSAGLTGDDTATITDTQQLLAAPPSDDTITAVDAAGVSAALDDTDQAVFVEAAVVTVETPEGAALATDDTGRLTEAGKLSAEAPGDDTATGVNAEDVAAATGDADSATFTDDQTLSAQTAGDDAGLFTEAALLTPDTGPTGAFTGESGWFTEAAALDSWPAFAAVTDDDPAVFTDTQSVWRNGAGQPWTELHPSSSLKVNIPARRVYLSSYLVDGEYPVSSPLPEAARLKLDAFAGALDPPARPGDVLEDDDFRYRYLSRWVSPAQRETGWYIVAWRRSPEAVDWLS